MTAIAITDPTLENAAVASRPARSVRRAGTRRGRPIEKGRILAIAGIGIAVVGGFAGAMTLLSGLAGPPPRPVLVMNTGAAEWPDLRDGVPALTRPANKTERAADAPPEAAPPTAAPVALRAAIDPVAPAQVVATTAKPTNKLPQIENAPLVAPLREAAVVASAPRTAALVRPSASETVKARTAAASTFTALPPEETTASVVEPTREIAKPRVKAAAVKPARAQPAEPAAAAVTEAADSDETEVLGLKIPSLAATGRKLREAFGGGDSASAASE